MELLLLLFKSDLSHDEIEDRIDERAEQYRSVPGLIQKFYVRDEQSHHIGGVLVFDSKENLQAFQASELAISTRSVYQFKEPPVVRVLDISRVLITNTVMTLHK
jgi:hypothetical protein